MRFRRLSILALALACSVPVFAQNEVLTWNQIALDTVARNSVAPPVMTRALAMMSTAQFDALNSIQGGYQGYAYQGTSDRNASLEAAAAQSAYRVLSSVFPSDEGAYRAQLDATLSRIGDEASRLAGIDAGNRAADAILNARIGDSSTYGGAATSSNEIGKWRHQSGNMNSSGLMPNWGNQQMWVGAAGSYSVPGAPDLTSSVYAHAYNEVKSLGAANSAVRTQDQTEVAYFWEAGTGTVTPPGMWNMIAANVAADRNMDMLETARMMGVMNVSMADAAIAAWNVKYDESFWRPITAIQNGSLDGNILTEEDASWNPLLPTPNHPSYVSGHSTFSASAAESLKLFLGTDSVSYTLTSAGYTRTFDSLTAGAMEAGMSRIYGGIHYSFDNMDGLNLGSSIGAFTFENSFQPVPEPATMLMLGLGALAVSRRRRKVS